MEGNVADIKKLAEQLWGKITSDYNEIEAFYNVKKPTIALNAAYKIAVMQNFMDSFERVMDEIESYGEDADVPYESEEIKQMIEFNGNLLDALAEGWGSFRHPENYDFWGYGQDDVPEIVSTIVREFLGYIKGGNYFERN